MAGQTSPRIQQLARASWDSRNKTNCQIHDATCKSLWKCHFGAPNSSQVNKYIKWLVASCDKMYGLPRDPWIGGSKRCKPSGGRALLVMSTRIQKNQVSQIRKSNQCRYLCSCWFKTSCTQYWYLGNHYWLCIQLLGHDWLHTVVGFLPKSGFYSFHSATSCWRHFSSIVGEVKAQNKHMYLDSTASWTGT